MKKTSSSFLLHPGDPRFVPANGSAIPQLSAEFTGTALCLDEPTAPVRYVHKTYAYDGMRRYTCAYVRDMHAIQVAAVYVNDPKVPFIKEVGRRLATGVLVNHIDEYGGGGERTVFGKDFMYFQIKTLELNRHANDYSDITAILGRYAVMNLTAMDYSHSYISSAIRRELAEGEVR